MGFREIGHEGLKLENEIIEIAKSYNIRILDPAENYKPILAIKSGRTYEGAKYEALFRQSGVIRVESVEELFNYGLAFSLIDIPKSNRVVILTNAGGPGIMAVDSAIRNIEIN